MTTDNWFTLLGAFGVVLVNAVVFTWFTREKIESVYNLAITKLEALGERESKARHDLANEVQRSISTLVLDDKALHARINDLSADMVRKADLLALEGRMTAILERLDGKVDELRDRVPH